MRSFFPPEKLTRTDYFAGVALLLFCFFSFWHWDILGTGWDSLNYLFGKPLDFYENCNKTRGGMQGTPYPPTIYAIFAIWLYPFKLFGLVKDASALPFYGVYWLKILTSLVYVGSGVIFFHTAKFYSGNENWSKYAAMLWLSTPLAMFSEFIFSQYDIFYVALALAGFLMFLRRNAPAAAVCFGLAVTFKYFPAFAFVPLLLLFEKTIPKILISLGIFAIPTAVIQLLYGRSAAFQKGVNNHNAIGRVYAAFVDVGGDWQVYYLFAFFAILCFLLLIVEVSDERLPRVAAYVFLVSSVLPFLFILWNPQWVMVFAPALAITTVIDKRCDKFLVLDLIGMLCFVGFLAQAFPGAADASLFRAEVITRFEFQNSYKMSRLFNFFGDHSANVFLSAFWAYLVVQLILKFKPSTTEFGAQGTFLVNYSNVRRRFYVGLLLFLLPASYAVFKDHRIGARLISNEVQGKHYGELLANRLFEQSFQAKGNSLYEVDLRLATFARKDSGLLVLEIVDSTNLVLYRSDTNIEPIKDNGWQVFIFNPIKLSEGATYRIRLTSPTGSPGNAITWWASEADSYPGGQAIVDGKPQSADFGFRAKFSK